MRIFVTGATGFIGGWVARKLRRRGDEVVCLVRSPDKAGELRGLGCELVAGDLGDIQALQQGIAGCSSVFHIAAAYKLGIWEEDCAGMHEANVQGTENVLRAAVDAGVEKILYVSTIGFFGNTRGRVVDETFDRTDKDWLSCYDETKCLAHEVAKRFIAEGAPVVIAQPGGVYGPDDPSDLGLLMQRIRSGRLKVMVMPSTGFNFLHVDDASDGIILAHDKGTIGESYVLGGELATMGDLIRAVAVHSGRKPPRRELPVAIIRRAALPWKVLAPMLGFPGNLKELVKASDGVTYWATDAKARRELGYSPRGLDEGIAETIAAG